MATAKELKKKYFEITRNSTDPQVHSIAYKELLVELYKLENDQRIFQYLQAEPFQNGIEAIFAYLLNEITPKEFYQLVADKCVQLYISNLLEFKLITEEVLSNLDGLCEEIVFEALKGLDTLERLEKRLYCGLKMPIREKQKLRKQDRVAYTAWFNILEKLHKHFSLPPVKEFSSYFFVGSVEAVGKQILLGNDFSEFHLKNNDLEKYRQLCR